MTDSPLVSVVMSVYNAERFLREAVESILDQTFKEFEFIIINDGSTDRSAVILEEYRQKDMRVIISTHPNNQGIVAALNSGLAKARGKYIARMDADDISLLMRIEKQVRFLDDHPDIGICGSWVQVVGREPSVIWKYPVTHFEIYAMMLFSCAIAHPSVMIRASALHQNELLYDINADFIEDYDLWSRALPLVRFANIPEPLLQYRLHGANTGDLHEDKQRAGRALIYERFASQLKVEYSEDEIALHEQIGLYKYGTNIVFLQNARKWLEKIADANEKTDLITSNTLHAELGQRWTQACYLSQASLLSICFEILASPLRFGGRGGFLKLWRGIRFFLGRTVSVKTR